MFIVLHKLKKVKGALKELNKVGCFNLQAAEARVYNQMIKARQQLHLDPGDASLAAAELAAIEEHKMKHADYVSFLSQKAEMMEWLRDGDENTRLFHQSIKATKLQNHVIQYQ